MPPPAVMLGWFAVVIAFSSIGLSNAVVHISNHTNNWAILAGVSRYWFNYRHASNALSMYRAVKRLGIPDNQIILMLADDIPCNARNVFPGEMFDSDNSEVNSYGNAEVDYRGSDVGVESLIRLLTGRHTEALARSKRLLTDANSNILIYMAGHGGDGFIKFQDFEELSSVDIADAFEQMHQQQRYNEILFVVDSCQASTLGKDIYSPNVIAIGSSRKGENSYSSGSHSGVGQPVSDRFTLMTRKYLDHFLAPPSVRSQEKIPSLRDLFSFYRGESPPGTFQADLGSTAEWYSTARRSLSDMLVTDFFGSVPRTYASPEAYPIPPSPSIDTAAAAAFSTVPADVLIGAATDAVESGVSALVVTSGDALFKEVQCFVSYISPYMWIGGVTSLIVSLVVIDCLIQKLCE